MNAGWVALATPLLVVLATYFFGLATKRVELRNAAARERYDHLYIPFMDWLVHVPLSWADPGHYSSDVRWALMKLLLENAQYMGPDSAELLMSLYDANSNLDALDVDHNQRYLLTAPKEYRQLFAAMSRALLSEASQLARVLQLPDLPKAIEAGFHHQ
ncbi:hypothetical protein [Lacticaseibacillus suibinensis]|uniref:hypothetical protein n=1 Tax=Lacticaseibacillus suibinensis TaxID=2486011 RepID=UPI000F7956A2|nr:hypothetical protein [Lacticaseibacillus suibinensis]